MLLLQYSLVYLVDRVHFRILKVTSYYEILALNILLLEVIFLLLHFTIGHFTGMFK